MTIARVIRGIRDRITGGDSSGRGIKLLGRKSQGEGPIEVLDLTELLRDAGAGASVADIQVLLDQISTTQGVIIYYDGTDWVALAPGTSGHFLKTNGAAANPSWANNGANPTGTGGDTAVNGSALTFMRSDGAPAIQKASSSAFGLAKVDDTTITASGGVISTVQGGIVAGKAVWGFHPLQYSADGIGVANALVANGGSMMCPIDVPAPMSLQGITFRNTDTANARSMEWRLYVDDNGTATADEIAGANGTDSWTPAAANTRDVACASPPVSILPGTYWLVIRNTHATNTLGIGSGAATNGLVPAYVKNLTLGSALGSTLDLDTSWVTTLFGNAIPAVRLNGRVLGKTALWS